MIRCKSPGCGRPFTEGFDTLAEWFTDDGARHTRCPAHWTPPPPKPKRKRAPRKPAAAVLAQRAEAQADFLARCGTAVFDVSDEPTPEGKARALREAIAVWNARTP